MSEQGRKIKNFRGLTLLGRFDVEGNTRLMKQCPTDIFAWAIKNNTSLSIAFRIFERVNTLKELTRSCPTGKPGIMTIFWGKRLKLPALINLNGMVLRSKEKVLD